MTEAEFKREQDRSYLILKAEDKEDYQIHMLKENEIKGILPFSIRSFNGEAFYYYDITSKQTYANLYSGRTMQWQDIRNFFTSMETVFEEMDRYLMDRSGICFQPEYCFKKPGEEKTEWVFIPGNQEGMLFMAEFLMEHVNHRDSEARELTYRFYSEVKEQTFCLSEFMKAFIGGEGEAEKPEIVTEFDSEPEWERETKEESRGEIKQEILKTMTRVSENKPENIWERIKGKVLHKKREETDREYCNKEQDYRRNVQPEQECEEYDNSVMHETMVLNRDSQIKGYLRPMVAKLRGRDICLNTFPCVIGKLPECADVVLGFNSISRMHARISKEGEEYYIEDLNSRNGTRLNGFPLEHSEKARLRAGDEVAFADLIYVFE